MTELKELVYQIINSQKAMGIDMLASACKVSPKQVIEVLDNELAKVVSKDCFDRVWDFLTKQDHMTFLTIVYGNVIEVKTKVVKGVRTHGYFNLFGKAPLNGHLKEDLITAIALISVPFMGKESHQIAFLNDEGNIMYSF